MTGGLLTEFAFECQSAVCSTVPKTRALDSTRLDTVRVRHSAVQCSAEQNRIEAEGWRLEAAAAEWIGSDRKERGKGREGEWRFRNGSTRTVQYLYGVADECECEEVGSAVQCSAEVSAA